MLPRPNQETLLALVRLRSSAPEAFEQVLRYLQNAEAALSVTMRDSNDPANTRLMQGATRTINAVFNTFSSAHHALTKRESTDPAQQVSVVRKF